MIAVVIPAYRVKDKIFSVIEKIDESVKLIFVVDDKCPENSGKFVEENCTDKRVKVLYNKKNMGVGGAVKTGFAEAMKHTQIQAVVKIDGDNQMDPTLLPKFVEPILARRADYVKGNRFFDLYYLRKMPQIRLFGNSVLSFINKFVTGYWGIMDPTNGYVAISRDILQFIPLEHVANRYFFESDMLFRLAAIRAVIGQVPMSAVYEDEKSSLRVSKILFSFPMKYANRFIKRIFYNYILRDFNIGSIFLLIGLIFFLFGLITGITFWTKSLTSGIPATSGSVMLAALPVIVGLQFLLAFSLYDISNVPKNPIINQIEIGR